MANGVFGTIQPEGIDEGVNFKTLLSSAIGKDFSEINSIDVKEWATAKGFRKKDVNRIARGFNKFSRRDSDFVLTGEGEFQVSDAQTSGRRTGNIKGFDVGDIVGLGRDVSTFAGALEGVQPQEDITSFEPGLSTTSDIEALTAGFSEPIELDGSANINAQARGASGQRGQQAAAQRKQQVQKDASPSLAPVTEGVSELGISPNESIDLDPNDIFGPLKRGEFTGERLDRGFLGNLRRTVNLPNVEALTFGSGEGIAQGIGQLSDTNFSDTVAGKIISNFQIAPGSSIKEMIRGIGSFFRSKEVAQRVLPEAKKLLQSGQVEKARKLLTSNIIPEARRLAQNAESLVKSIVTRPPATRVGNVGFRPKRFGGKMSKFSR